MKHYESIPAIYTQTGVSRFDGNPLIEALPPLEVSKEKILERIEFNPPKFTGADRTKGDLVRIAELSRIASVIYPFAEYSRTAANATMNLREAYVARNPLTPLGQRRRTLIGTMTDEQSLSASQLRSTALGQTILGVTGSGKTTFGRRFLEPYCVVIEHTEYRGRPFMCRQIPVIHMNVMHDATMLSFCIQFFDAIDRILGNTHYAREAKSIRRIALMALLAQKVATAVSLGGVFIDDLQHLRAARSGQAEIVLNFFSQFIELAGVSIIFAGTPALGPVIEKSVRNVRKMTSGGATSFPLMGRNDPQWSAFCDALWGYRIVRNLGPLDKSTRAAWHNCSGGNPAFTAMSFLLAQRQEIGSREVVDSTAFERVAATEMSFLRPAINAVLSKRQNHLERFDDLVFKGDLDDLREWVGREESRTEGSKIDPEFEQVQHAEELSKPRKPRVKARSKSGTGKAHSKTRRPAPEPLPTIAPRI
ncbi:ATP-binding protein [Variovorax sp. KK3]|uniref:ATP-binding protein n=1 Tax=Variovorax sp. KK3 TaxID=1855728 RepID=UPI0009F85518|nr:ATP-binding protein [Variovorax sp. KK3]